MFNELSPGSLAAPIRARRTTTLKPDVYWHRTIAVWSCRTCASAAICRSGGQIASWIRTSEGLCRAEQESAPRVYSWNVISPATMRIALMPNHLEANEGQPALAASRGTSVAVTSCRILKVLPRASKIASAGSRSREAPSCTVQAAGVPR